MRTREIPCIETLFRQICSENPGNAFELFLENWQIIARIQAFLKRRGASPTEAEDLCQDTLLIFYKKCFYDNFSFKHLGGALRFLYTTASNLWCQKLRSRRRSGGLILSLDEHKSLWQVIPDLAPLESAQACELEEVAKHCFSLLSPRSRQLLQGFYLEGSSYEDLAKALSYSSPNVAKQRTHIIRGKLKRDIQKRLVA